MPAVEGTSVAEARTGPHCNSRKPAIAMKYWVGPNAAVKYRSGYFLVSMSTRLSVVKFQLGYCRPRMQTSRTVEP